MMRVLSPIYPPEIKPVRDGWYLTRHASHAAFEAMRRWDGIEWLSPAGIPYEDQSGWYWRGLAFCPYSAISTTHTDVSIASQRVYEIEGVFVPGATCC